MVSRTFPSDVEERIKRKFKNYKLCKDCGKRNPWGASSCRSCGKSSPEGSKKKWYRIKAQEPRG